MTYAKSFPSEGPNGLPRWREVVLTDQEERQEEQKARTANLMLMRQCLSDAQQVVAEEHVRDYQTSVIQIALCIFKKRSSHEVFWKDRRCKAKFDAMIASEKKRIVQNVKPRWKKKAEA